jgi:PAS domain S-box-containing protein
MKTQSHSMPLSGAYTLLIVDDNPIDRDTYKSFLHEQAQLKFNFFEAEDADEALKICRTVHIDCVLLDFELPDVDGLELMEQMRNAEGQVLPPVVMVTGRGSETVAVEAIRKGAVDYVVKSEVTASNLFHAVFTAIDRAESLAWGAREKLEREETERDLRRSEERFRLLVDGVHNYAIIMVDPKGRVVSWNSGARRLLDYHDREILGHHVRVLFTPEDSAAAVPEAELQNALKGQSVSDDRWHVKKNGERFWATGVVTAIYDDFHELRGYAKILHDMTERRKTESSLKNALTARDEFLTVASHELKTPITALKFQVQGLLRAIDRDGDRKNLTPARLRELLLRTDRQVSRLTTLVENLLDISRINSDTLQLVFEEFCVTEVVQTLLADLQKSFEAHAMQVHLQIDSASLQVIGVRWRLVQVLTNLFVNAMTYARGKPITVRLRQHGEQVEVSVQDQGPGLDAEQQSRIFDRFERATPASEAAGLGLGLYISRKVMEAMNGSLWVHCVPEKGCTFFIRLPAVGPPAAANAAAGSQP